MKILAHSFSDKIQILLTLPSWYRSSLLFENISGRFPALGRWYASYQQRRFDKVTKVAAKVEASTSFEHAYITNIPHVTVGIGHTLSEYNAGRVYAQALGLKYAHCPFPEPWEQLLNFGEDEVSIAKLKQAGVKCVRLPRFNNRLDEDALEPVRRFIAWHAKRFDGNVLFLLAYGQNVYDHSSTELILRGRYKRGLVRDGVLPEAGQGHRTLTVGPLRRPAFWTPSVHEDRRRQSNEFVRLRLRDLRMPGKVNVAVHVRVPNAADTLVRIESSSTAKNQTRYLSIDYFLERCLGVEQEYGADCVHFNLFVQSDAANFKMFDRFQSVRFCSDSDAYETFFNMTLSDVLITSPSSFSFKAGMLNSGTKISPSPWWHKVPHSNGWIQYNVGAKFN